MHLSASVVAECVQLFLAILLLQDAVEGTRIELTDPKTGNTRWLGENCGEGCFADDEKPLTTLWHATNKVAAKGIMTNNFRPGSGGTAGGAIYFAAKMEIARDKTVKGNEAIIKTTVNLGCVKRMTTHEALREYRARNAEQNKTFMMNSNCDSLKIMLGNTPVEYAIFDAKQVVQREAVDPKGEPLDLN